MNDIRIRRKRLIPQETIDLDDDLILRRDNQIVVTSWTVLRPRPDLARGFSCYYLNEDVKVSRMVRADDTFFWYCDIADYVWEDDGATLLMTDLLADVVVETSGEIRVLDLDELAKARDMELIDDRLLKKSLCTLDRLLRELYSRGVERLAAPINKICENR